MFSMECRAFRIIDNKVCGSPWEPAVNLQGAVVADFFGELSLHSLACFLWVVRSMYVASYGFSTFLSKGDFSFAMLPLVMSIGDIAMSEEGICYVYSVCS